jgi:hypothetical protein
MRNEHGNGCGRIVYAVAFVGFIVAAVLIIRAAGSFVDSQAAAMAERTTLPGR